MMNATLKSESTFTPSYSPQSTLLLRPNYGRTKGGDNPFRSTIQESEFEMRRGSEFNASQSTLNFAKTMNKGQKL